MLYERNMNIDAVLLAAKYANHQFKNIDNSDEENAEECIDKLIEDYLYMGSLKESLNAARATAVRRPKVSHV